MKTKITLLSLLVFFAISNVNAQVKGPKSIISTTASMKKYYEKAELDGLQKGQLLELYIERIKVLVNTLPYIALTSKAGVTLNDVGIPDTPESAKQLDNQIESTNVFLAATVGFQKSITPYADKGNLVKAILYYQDMLKQLHQLEE
jgi:hypothetical protein